MVAILLGADNGFFYAGQIMHFSSPFTVFLIYHKQLNEQAKNDTAIEAYMFASEFYQHCQEVQNKLWAEQTQKIHDDLSAIFEILPAGFSNVYNVSILSEDQTVHIGIGQIVAQFLKKAAYQYPKFIPDSYIGRF